MGKFGGLGNMQGLLKQAQQMQQQMAKAQEQLEETEVEASSGNGMVTVVLNGKKALRSIKIDPSIVDPDDVEMLEDLIVAAFNEASEKADEVSAEIMAPFGAAGSMF